jgi:hypothetical protein
LWAALEWFEAHGYQFTWHHLRQHTNPWHAWVHRLAEEYRIIMAAWLHEVATSIATGGTRDSTEPVSAGTITEADPNKAGGAVDRAQLL